MEIICKNCGEVYLISDKKRGYNSNRNISKSMKISVCKTCGAKNFYSILSKYSDKNDLI